jgi:hypothetical protein
MRGDGQARSFWSKTKRECCELGSARIPVRQLAEDNLSGLNVSEPGPARTLDFTRGTRGPRVLPHPARRTRAPFHARAWSTIGTRIIGCVALAGRRWPRGSERSDDGLDLRALFLTEGLAKLV